jgi:hypothetical protein
MHLREAVTSEWRVERVSSPPISIRGAAGGQMQSSTHLHCQFQSGHSQSEESVTILCRFLHRRCLTDRTTSGLLHSILLVQMMRYERSA